MLTQTLLCIFVITSFSLELQEVEKSGLSEAAIYFSEISTNVFRSQKFFYLYVESEVRYLNTY